jgi:ribosomal-protein-alanine N-acetyltransferase
MRIQREQFVLRRERPEDAAAVAKAFADDPGLAVDWGIDEVPDEAKAAGWIAEHIALWDEGQGRHFAIADPRDDALVGGVNFHRFEPAHRRAEVGFWLAPGARGRGIGSAAIEEACRWAFDRFELNRIEMTTLPGNEAALGLARKLGFTREGLLRSRNYERGEYVDIVILSLLRSDWGLSPAPR